MVDVSYQMVLSTLQTVGLLVGIIYYIVTLQSTRKNQEISLRNQEETLKTRNATLFLQTLGQMLTNNEALQHVIRVEQHPFTRVEEFNELRKDPDYFLSNTYLRLMCEFWGIFLKNDIIDIEMLSQFLPYWIPRFWEWNKESIYESRNNLPGYFNNLEYLAESLQKHHKNTQN